MNTRSLILAFCIFLASAVTTLGQGQFSQTSTADFNGNTNVNVNTAGDQVRLSPYLGNGEDGVLYVAPATTYFVDSIRTTVTDNNPTGQNGIRVGSTAGLAPGDEVLIITMQDSTPDPNNVTGQYEFRFVQSVTATIILFTENLERTYNAATWRKHQVLRVPHYESVTVATGGVLTAHEWNGSTGGVLCFRSRGLVNILAFGQIDMSGKGYRGGPPVTSNNNTGYQGESRIRSGSILTPRNDGAGGGGNGWLTPKGGGGAGYSVPGMNGQGGSLAGEGGTAYGDQFFSRFFLGAGGGSGGVYGTGCTGYGGEGGGFIAVFGSSIICVGSIRSEGENGGNATSGSSAGGGGGSGGSILLVSRDASALGNQFVSAAGGQPGNGYNGNYGGGSGAAGRIRTDGPYTGTTNPPVGYNGTTYAWSGSTTTPTIVHGAGQTWSTLTFHADTSAFSVHLYVDVLNNRDSVLLSGVRSGTNLTNAGVWTDSIRLRARLTTGAADQTPSLLDWTLNWAAVTPPVAEFTGQPTQGLVPLSVQFTDYSTGVTNSWQWDFGDGTTSTGRNPTHLYSSPGAYTVSLTAGGPGGSNTRVRTNYISVTAPPPVADFVATPTSGNVPLTVNFSNLSTGYSVSYVWAFGDGASDTAANPVHVYNLPGLYSVTLVAVNAWGCDTLVRTNYLTVLPPRPVVSFNGTPCTGVAPLLVQFQDSSQGQITNWSWSFGDGQNSNSQNPQHVYAVAGNYDVMLRVTGPGGADSLRRVGFISVSPPPPIACFTADPRVGPVPLAVQFSSQCSENAIASYLWQFGDGGTSTQANPSHIYSSIGSFSVILVVAGPGGTDTLTVENYVQTQVPRPTAGFVALPTDGYAPLLVRFMNQSTYDSMCFWDFGNGATSFLRNPEQLYTQPGTFTVRLIVSNSSGTDTLIRVNYITVRALAAEDRNSVPEHFVVEDNYPNPFNPSTRISYALPSPASVVLHVYDLQGRLVSDQDLGPQPSGWHSITVDGSGWAAGAYFYSLQCGKEVASGKMMLMK